MCAYLLSLPMRCSKLYIIISVEAINSLMSCFQDTSFSLGSNMCSVIVWI